MQLDIIAQKSVTITAKRNKLWKENKTVWYAAHSEGDEKGSTKTTV